MTVYADSATRYADAVERRALVIAAWEELGRPVLCKGGATGRAAVPHPLVGMMREADALCDRLSKSLRSAQRGRPVGAVSARDRFEQFEHRDPPPVLRVAKRSASGD